MPSESDAIRPARECVIPPSGRGSTRCRRLAHTLTCTGITKSTLLSSRQLLAFGDHPSWDASRADTVLVEGSSCGASGDFLMTMNSLRASEECRSDGRRQVRPQRDQLGAVSEIRPITPIQPRSRRARTSLRICKPPMRVAPAAAPTSGASRARPKVA